jgi:hypothetical protein
MLYLKWTMLLPWRERGPMRRIFLLSLVIVLAAPPFAAAASQAPAAPVPVSVAHSPVGCMVAGTNPRIDAGITPSEQVQAGRVYFKSVLGDAFYYVEMAPEAGRYVGVLPKPRPDAGPITYYVEGVGRDYAQSQTPEQRATVVDKSDDCGDKPVAALGPSDPVRVFSVAGGTALPPGFSGVSSVVATGAGAAAAGAGTAAAGAGAAAAGGAAVSGTTVLIAAGAVAVGVGTVVLVTRGEKNPPASPSR